MTRREPDRLVALKKAGEKLITQKQAAQQIGLSERQVRRLLAKLRGQGDPPGLDTETSSCRTGGSETDVRRGIRWMMDPPRRVPL